MKTKKFLVALALTFVVGASATVYAETASNSANQGLGLGRITSMRGYDYVSSVLKNKLGMTDKEINDGFNSGKTMYDLAKEKGMTEDQFKTALLEERNKDVDKAVVDGKITKEEGVSLKETLKNNESSCIGTPGQRMSKGERGNGHMSGGGTRGAGNCYINNTVE